MVHRFILFVLLSALVQVASGNVSRAYVNALRLNVQALNAPIELTMENNTRDNFSIGQMNWLKDKRLHDRSKYVCGAIDTSMQWKQATLTVFSESDDRVSVQLMSTHTNPTLMTQYDQITVDSKLIPNGGFEQGFEHFKVTQGKPKSAVIVKDPGLIRFGEACVAVNHNSHVTFSFDVKAKVPTVVTFWYCVMAPQLIADGHIPLDLAPFVNRDYADAQEGDGKGGWTDQGPVNDMSNFDLDRTMFGGPTFKLVHPDKNNGKGVAVFDSQHLKTGLETITVPVGKAARYLYVLHTSAWNSTYATDSLTATIEATMVDGKTVSYPVRVGHELVDWWLAGNLDNGMVVYRRSGKQKQAGIFLSKFALPEGVVVNIRFKTAGNGVYILLGATLANRDYRLSMGNIKAGKEYKPADIRGAFIEAGSALDLSRFNTPNAVESLGRVVLSKDGRHLEYEKRPGVPARFRATYHFSRPLPKESVEAQKAHIDRYVETASRAGYNMIRTHIIDSFAKANNREDFTTDPKLLDLIDYFFFKCKQHGIYVNFNTGAYQLSAKERTFTPEAIPLKPMFLLGDERIRKSWIEMTKYLVHRVNKYTGIPMCDDPMLVLVEPYNELSLGLRRMEGTIVEPLAMKRFQEYLDRRAPGRNYKAKLSGFDAGSELQLLWNEFVAEVTHESMAFMINESRKLGYKGYIGQFNVAKNLLHADVREKGSDIVISNTYFCHPTKFDRPGSRTGQNNPFAEGVSHFRATASQRDVRKPLIVTEYNLAWGNQYKYAHFMYPAYAALQGYSALTLHETHRDMIARLPSITFNSLIDRPLEYMAAFLFQRGDIAESPNRVTVQIPRAMTQSGKTLASNIPGSQTRLSLVMGFGIDVVDEDEKPAKTIANEIQIPLVGSANVESHDWFITVNEGVSNFKIDSFIEGMKARKLLPADNKTNVENNLWQSDTGELTLDGNNNTFTVQTARSEAVAFEANMTMRLDALRKVNSSVPASVMLTSLKDDQPLKTTDHALLIYVTTVMNTGMERSSDHATLIKNGKEPVLIKTGTLRCTLSLKANTEYTVYPLSCNGIRRAPMTVKTDGAGNAELLLDTAALPEGPTFYFEFVAK